MKGNIYFLRDKQFVKVGFAVDVPSRISGLQTGNPRTLELMAVLPDAHPTTEKLFHAAFAKYRTRGEWFRLKSAIRGVIEFIDGGARPSTIDEIRALMSLEREMAKERKKKAKDEERRRLFFIEIDDMNRTGARL